MTIFDASFTKSSHKPRSPLSDFDSYFTQGLNGHWVDVLGGADAGALRTPTLWRVDVEYGFGNDAAEGVLDAHK